MNNTVSPVVPHYFIVNKYMRTPWFNFWGGPFFEGDWARRDTMLDALNIFPDSLACGLFAYFHLHRTYIYGTSATVHSRKHRTTKARNGNVTSSALVYISIYLVMNCTPGFLNIQNLAPREVDTSLSLYLNSTFYSLSDSKKKKERKFLKN
jgi:hypothetical protein